jgi:hypothetical protein
VILSLPVPIFCPRISQLTPNPCSQLELETIIQSTPSLIRTHLLQIELNSAQESLKDANDLALRRSGTRGKAAREEVKKWENVLFKLEER